MTRVKSYDGVKEVELFITTRVAYHEEWLIREINKKLSRIQKQKLDCLLLNSSADIIIIVNKIAYLSALHVAEINLAFQKHE